MRRTPGGVHGMTSSVAEVATTMTPGARPRRAVLKLSGEVFGGGAVGVDPEVRLGVQVAVVVGGGNFFRGAELEKRGMDRARADYMGMIATVMNCLALQDFLERAGIDTRVQTAI